MQQLKQNVCFKPILQPLQFKANQWFLHAFEKQGQATFFSIMQILCKSWIFFLSFVNWFGDRIFFWLFNHSKSHAEWGRGVIRTFSSRLMDLVDIIKVLDLGRCQVTTTTKKKKPHTACYTCCNFSRDVYYWHHLLLPIWHNQ